MSSNILELLQKHSVQDVETAKKDIEDALKHFKNLKLESDPDSDSLCLTGDLPVEHKHENVPVKIVLKNAHPYAEPVAYVLPTEEMLVNVSEMVDLDGKVSLIGLLEWEYPNTDLYMFLNLLCIKFGEKFPLYSKVASPRQLSPRGSIFLANGSHHALTLEIQNSIKSRFELLHQELDRTYKSLKNLIIATEEDCLQSVAGSIKAHDYNQHHHIHH